MSINISRDNSDPTYRYKMPKLVTKIEGRGNGIKTVIVNMADVAKALHVDPTYPTKFFGIELGAQSTYDRKIDRAVVNGAHNQPDMQELLFKFIDLFVLCPTCKLPEIKMEIKKVGIKIDCAACGHNSKLMSAHKLVGFILKNPVDKPAGGAAGSEEGKKAAAKPGKGKKGEEAEDASASGNKKGDKEDKAVEWFTDTSAEAQKQRMEAEFNEMHAKTSSDAAVEAIMSKANSAGESKIESPVTVLKIFVAEKSRSPVEIVNEAKRLQLARGLEEAAKLKCVLEALIDPANAVADFKKYSPTLKLLVPDRIAATMFINVLEEFIGVTDVKLLKFTAHILQTLYENDVLEEESIVAWADSPPESSWKVSKEIAVDLRKRAKPFVEWLKTAQDDEEED